MGTRRDWFLLFCLLLWPWRVPTCLEPDIKLAAGNRSVTETDPVPAVVGITVLEGHDPNII